MSIGKFTLLSVVLCCASWVTAQTAPAGGAAPAGGSGSAGQSSTPGSPATPPAGTATPPASPATTPAGPATPPAGTATPPAGTATPQTMPQNPSTPGSASPGTASPGTPPQIQICPDLLLPERRLRVAPHNLRRSIRAHRILQAARPAALRAELCPALQTVRPVQPRTQDRQRRIHQPREAGTLGVLAVPRPVRLQRREILVHR